MSKQVKRLKKFFNKISELNRLQDEGNASDKQSSRTEKKRLNIKQYGPKLPSAGDAWNPKGKQKVRA